MQQYASGTEETVDISIEDVTKAKEKLLESFAIINDFYIKDLVKFPFLNSKEQYQFVIKAYEVILGKKNNSNNDENKKIKDKNVFVLLARKVKRYLKMAYSVVSQEEATMTKCIEIINALISTSSITQDDKLQNTIELIKEAIAQAIDFKTSEVFVSETKISKNINDVAEILALEAKDLAQSSPRVAIEMMKHSIKANLQDLQNIRPVFAKKASEKLREIINSLQREEDVHRVMELLITLSKDIVDEKEKPLEFQDRQLQAFFEILSNDGYLKNHKNSEILRRISEELVDTIKKCGTEQYENNPQVRSKIKVELQKLLKNKYDYPPKNADKTSGLLVNQLTQEITINQDFFRRGD